MIEFITTNKEGVVGALVALVALAGTIIRLTATKADDGIYNKIVNAVGLGRFEIK
jgi:hypothetical protein